MSSYVPYLHPMDEIQEEWVESVQDSLRVITGIPFIREEMTLVSGWEPYGSGYASPQVMKFGQIVVMSGLAKATAAKTAPTNIGSISSSFWPRSGVSSPLGGRLIFMNLYTSAGTYRVDVTATGGVVLQAGTATIPVGGWVSVNGMWIS